MTITTPAQVAGDPELRQRFQHEVAYRDGRSRDPRVVGYDAEVLASPSGLLAVAWLWPDQMFPVRADPFESAAAQAPQEWSARLGTQVQHRMREAVGAVVGHGAPQTVDILGYLMWQADLSEGDVVRLREGVVDQLAVWVSICRWLHLQFDGRGWRISDPARLARRIEQAGWASGVASRLKHVPTRRLKDLWQKLPQQDVDDPVPPLPRDVYRAPKGRYRGLYLVLAEDRSESPTYTIGDINDILARHGENPLPPSATKDTSWWAGRGTKTEGRPQIAAWWAAGYRIKEDPGGELAVARARKIELDLIDEGYLSPREVTEEEREEMSAITDVTFEALPGRREWLDDPDRVHSGEYPMPDSVVVPLPPPKLTLPQYDSDDRALMTYAHPFDVLQWDPDAEPESDAASDQQRGGQAEEAELTALVQLLQDAGEMDREQIVHRLPAGGDDPGGAHPSDRAGADPDRSGEVKSLLTRARRRGLIINRGTNRKPRWVAVGSKGDLVLRIAESLNERRSDADQPTIEIERVGPGDTLPPGFLAQVASRLGLPVPRHATEAGAAEAIIKSAGADWNGQKYASSGGRLTRDGLQAVSDAVLDPA